MKLNIVYEDNDVLVINKPAELIIHKGIKTEKTLVDLLIDYFPEIKDVGEDISRPGIVHRLDKDTSGLMVVAKNNKAFDFLKKQFSASANNLNKSGFAETFGEGGKERKVEKKYLTLVCGIVKNKEGIIESFIGRMENEQISVKSEEEVLHRKAKIKNLKKAITEYKVLKYLNNHTLCEALPKTGRMHQIRVHFKSIGYPVAGDLKYGSKNCSCAKKIPRQFLHAKYLSFALPNGKKMAFEADLPGDLSAVLNLLEN